MSNIDWSLNKIIMILTSAIIHAALMVGICCTATEQKEKPIEMESRLIKLPMLPPEPSPKPPQPQPKPPQPQPQPQPPRPQPPKPVEVKPDQPRVNRVDDIRARLNDATVVPTKPQPQPQPQPQPYTPPRPVPPPKTPSAEEYKRKFLGDAPPDIEVKLSPSKGTTSMQDSKDYANNYAAAVLYEHWNPSRAGMKYAKPSPVYITMTVTASGRVTNVQITTKSNDSVMNSSVEELLKQIKSGQIEFPSLKSAGINRSFLTMTIGLHLKD